MHPEVIDERRAEDEEGSCWESLATERGISEGRNAVTVFAGYGLQGIVDEKSRDPESLAQSFAECLKAFQHPKLYPGADALVVVCYRVTCDVVSV